MIAGEMQNFIRHLLPMKEEILRLVTEEWMERCREVIHGLLIR